MAETAKQISINDVVDGGVKLSLLLNAVGCEALAEEVEIHSIAKAVSLFSLDLKQIGRGFQAADSLHSVEALSTARRIAVQGRVIFDEIEQMLDQSRGTGGYFISPDLSLDQRVSQFFKPHRVTYLLAHLESLQLSLKVMSLVLQIGRSTDARRYYGFRGKPPTNETLQQERVDAQNMVVVRHWSVSRLNGLYDLSKREAYQSHTGESTAPTNQPGNPPPSTPFQLPVIPLMESETYPSSMTGSPRDMVRESASVVDMLISLWILPDVSTKNTSEAQATKENNRNFGGTGKSNPQSDNMNGTTYCWRPSRSSPPRKDTSCARDRYPAYQARVDSDSDSSDSGKSRKTSRSSNDILSGTSDADSSMSEQIKSSHGEADLRRDSRPKGSDAHSYPYPKNTKSSRSDRNANLSSAARPNMSSKRSPMPTSEYQQNNNGAYHPAPFPAQYQNQHRNPPPLHYDLPERRPSSPSRHSRRRSSSSLDYRPSYDSSPSSWDARHRRFRRNATKGILGIGALAGFLAAVEGI